MDDDLAPMISAVDPGLRASTWQSRTSTSWPRASLVPSALLGIDLVVFLGGVAWAFYIKSNDRAKYETIGRLVNEGLDSAA